MNEVVEKRWSCCARDMARKPRQKLQEGWIKELSALVRLELITSIRHPVPADIGMSISAYQVKYLIAAHGEELWLQ